VRSSRHLAVLPCLNLSGDLEQDDFADGMVEELTSALSRILLWIGRFFDWRLS
jgi:TolB-like protein